MLIQSNLLQADTKRKSETAPVTTCGHFREYKINSWYDNTFKQGQDHQGSHKWSCQWPVTRVSFKRA